MEVVLVRVPALDVQSFNQWNLPVTPETAAGW